MFCVLICHIHLLPFSSIQILPPVVNYISQTDYKRIIAKVFSSPSELCSLLNICFVIRVVSEALSNKTPGFPLVNCQVNALDLQEIFFQGETNLVLNWAVLNVYSSQHWRSIDYSVLCALRAEMVATVVRKKLHFCRGQKTPELSSHFQAEISLGWQKKKFQNTNRSMGLNVLQSFVHKYMGMEHLTNAYWFQDQR